MARSQFASAGVVRIETGNIGAVDVSVAVAPYVTVFAGLSDAIAGVRPGLPTSVRRAIQNAVPADGHRALAPIGDPRYSMVPDCLLPITPRENIDVRAPIEVMRASEPSLVAGSIAAAFETEVPPHWRQAVDAPARWIKACATAAAAAAQAMSGTWVRGRPLIDREIERIGVAAVTGATDVLVGSLTQRLRVDGDALVFRDVQPGTYDLAGRRIVLVPLLCGSELLMTNVEQPDIVWIGYPVPGIGRLSEVDPTTAGSSNRLALLLGPQRAAILVFLSRPATMAEAARELNCAPNTLTFHCQHLEALDLVHRERRGRSVRVSRTLRARTLIETMLAVGKSG